MKVLLLSFLIAFSGLTQAAKCKVNGKWYPYSDPICSAADNRKGSTALRRSQQPTENPDNPVCKIPKQKAIADIKAKLGKKYPGSYSLQKTLLDGHLKAYHFLCSEPATDVNVEILEKKLKRYYPSFSLIQTLYEADKKAYGELNK